MLWFTSGTGAPHSAHAARHFPHPHVGGESAFAWLHGQHAGTRFAAVFGPASARGTT